MVVIAQTLLPDSMQTLDTPGQRCCKPSPTLRCLDPAAGCLFLECLRERANTQTRQMQIRQIQPKFLENYLRNWRVGWLSGFLDFLLQVLFGSKVLDLGWLMNHLEYFLTF